MVDVDEDDLTSSFIDSDAKDGVELLLLLFIVLLPWIDEKLFEVSFGDESRVLICFWIELLNVLSLISYESACTSSEP